MVDLSRQRLINRPVSGGDRATYSEMVRLAALGALFVGLILTYSWNQMKILSIQYELEALKSEQRRLQETNAKLRAEYKSLTSPEKIARTAGEMGLISSNQPQVRIIQAPADAPAPNLVAKALKQKDLLRE